jgi:hypothetical protein
MSDDTHAPAGRRPDDDREFEFDLRRTVLLGLYMRQWGMPQYRKRATDHASGDVLEVYSFPGTPDAPVHRFATVGVSAGSGQAEEAGKELMMVLPADLAGATDDEVFDYMLDIAAYLLRTRGPVEAPFQVPESPLAPRSWKTRAVLVDEARGESEDLAEVEIGRATVEVLWVVPIHGSEYRFIKEHGIEAFDELAEQAELSVVDVDRDPFVQDRA